MLKKFEKHSVETKLPKLLVDLRITHNGIDIILVDEEGGWIADLYSTHEGAYELCKGKLKLKGFDTSWAVWDVCGAFIRFSGDE